MCHFTVPDTHWSGITLCQIHIRGASHCARYTFEGHYTVPDTPSSGITLCQIHIRVALHCARYTFKWHFTVPDTHSSDITLCQIHIRAVHDEIGVNFMLLRTCDLHSPQNVIRSLISVSSRSWAQCCTEGQFDDKAQHLSWGKRWSHLSVTLVGLASSPTYFLKLFCLIGLMLIFNSYRVFLKKVLHKREEKMQEKMKMTQQSSVYFAWI